MCHISSVSGFKIQLATLFLSTAGLPWGSSIAAFLLFLYSVL